MKRRRFLQASAAAGLGLVLPGQAADASIQSLSGRVFANKNRATLDTLIQAGDLVTTSHDGRIAFTVGKDAFLLKERTSMQVGDLGDRMHGAVSLSRVGWQRLESRR